MAKPRRQVIRASEIGEYLFCARSWWLRRAVHLEPEGHERRAYGTLLHQRHSQAVASSRVLLLLALLLLAGAAVLLIAGH